MLLLVYRQLDEEGISVFEFPGLAEEQEEDCRPPFTVVGSNVVTVGEDGRQVRAREYPWGTVNIENKVVTSLHTS